MVRWSLFLFPIFLFGTELRLGDQTLEVEVVDTDESRGRGLMGRSSLNEGSGMLFVYEEPQMLTFWMKETKTPLSIGFFDSHQLLINTADMDPPAKNQLFLPVYQSARPALYALEVPQGWFKKHKMKPGTKFYLKNSFLDQAGSLK